MPVTPERLAQIKQWQRNNRDKVRAIVQRYHQAHPDEWKKYYRSSQPEHTNRIPKRKLYLVATKGVWGKVAQDYRDHVIPLDNDIHAIIKSWKIVRAA